MLSTLRPRLAARRAKARIRVVERPGADHEAPAHDMDSADCWCEPILDDIGDVYLLEHRIFEN